MKPGGASETARERSALRVGFIGLGQMGRPMAERIAAAGFSLIGFDVDARAAERFRRDAHGRVAASLTEVGRESDVVITMLPNGALVRDVILGTDPAGENGVAAALSPGSVVIDCSSSAPPGTRHLGERLSGRSIALVDAPVSGGVARAEAGTLAIMAGGEQSAIERCRPVLAALGQQLFLTGPLGSGHALKALNNLVSAAGLLAAAEALLIGRRFGLDPAVMVDVFNASSARNNSTENKFKQFILSRRFSSGFSLALMVKDLATALDLAAATDTPAPFATSCRELWSTAQAQLEAGADHTALVRWLERVAGTTLEGAS